MAHHHRDKEYTGQKEIGLTMSDEALEAIAKSYKDACFMGNGVVMFDGEKYRNISWEMFRKP